MSADNDGCLFIVLAAVVVLVGLAMGGGGDAGTTTNTTTDTRSGVLSGNQVEMLSRNQLNLWSDVQNCYGDYSCMTVISTTTSSTTNTSNTSTNVDGERNVIYSSSGVRLCPNPDKPNEWGDVAAWCEAIGVQP